MPHKAQNILNENLPTKRGVQSHFVGKEWFYSFLYYLCLTMALTGIVPVVVFFIEHNLAGLYAFVNHFGKCKNYCPRVAVLIPAWNEALVLEHTINILLMIDYPLDNLRLYIIDDGSTDNTQELLKKKHLEYPQNIINVYKEGGGNGKAHAINYGLNVVLADDWAQALLFIDADVAFKKDALRRMARHLADPDVGAVTAYIKVGNRNTNFITRSIGFEYIVSQSITRRAQSVLGVVACLAGGAQLHTRENIEQLGSEINTSTLAEDTYTTFATQKLGKKVIFEGNAFVYAEEPKTIIDVWKQRFRWARGNIQITKAFKDVWFRSKHTSLGNFLFGIIWFCVVLTPIIMILAAIGLIGLFILDKEHSSHIFFYLASISLFVYLYTTIFALFVDRRTSKLSFLEGIMYPGLVSLFILCISINPPFFFKQLSYLLNTNDSTSTSELVLLFMESWSALCMFWAWVVFRFEFAGLSPRITNFLLMVVGYGPLLCTINLAAYIAEIKRPNLRWDKTEKISSKRILRSRIEPLLPFDFDKALAKDFQREYRFFCLQLISIGIVCGLFILFHFLKF
ncbi:glycosyltransferase [Legionella fallonii]|uniref:glycosyltransferase n=1 Tax=Legionella fallonii TaxID=96230 RepID=UPI00155B1202|nr:glycosyltransferase [Legionella fallonii]